jgi:hypothetical protein
MSIWVKGKLTAAHPGGGCLVSEASDIKKHGRVVFEIGKRKICLAATL